MLWQKYKHKFIIIRVEGWHVTLSFILSASLQPLLSRSIAGSPVKFQLSQRFHYAIMNNIRFSYYTWHNNKYNYKKVGNNWCWVGFNFCCFSSSYDIISLVVLQYTIWYCIQFISIHAIHYYTKGFSTMLCTIVYWIVLVMFYNCRKIELREREGWRKPSNPSWINHQSTEEEVLQLSIEMPL